jgi:hypothetical protein
MKPPGISNLKKPSNSGTFSINSTGNAIKTRLLVILTFFSLAQASPFYHKVNPHLLKFKEVLYTFDLDSARAVIRDFDASQVHEIEKSFHLLFLDFIDYSQDVTKLHVAKRVEEASNAILQKYESSPDSKTLKVRYYLALTMGIKGLYHVVRDEFLSAYWYGSDGLSILEDIVEEHPDFKDAYLGLGLFHYYLDLLPGILKFFTYIFGFEADRALGLKEIEAVANNGTYFKVEARFALGLLFYFVEGDREKAIFWYYTLTRKYAANPLLNLMLGVYYRDRKDFESAKKYTLKTINDRHFYRFGSLIHGAYYNYAKCFFAQNQIDSTYDWFARMDRIPTRKSTYYRATIDYWKGYTSELQGKRKKALFMYHKVRNNETTQRWYDFAAAYKAQALTPTEIRQIFALNAFESDSVHTWRAYLEAHRPQKMTPREKGFHFMISGIAFAQKNQSSDAMAAFSKAAEHFQEVQFAPMLAQVYARMTALAIAGKNIDKAEQCYALAENYEERYFQIQLRKFWTQIENLKNTEGSE